MLPIITLHASQVFDVGFDMINMRQGIYGQTYAYNWDAFVKDCAESDINVDTCISDFAAQNLLSKRAKTKVLILYTKIGAMFFLTACSLKQRLPCHWLMKLPDYLESGQDYLKQNALPYLYWDGENMYRLYLPPKDYQPGDALISNFNSSIGLTIELESPADYEHIKANPAKFPAYSVVPQESEQILTVKKKDAVLKHAFFEMVE